MKPRLLVATTTYPRWRGDTVPAFVHELCRHLGADFDVTVLCPHAPRALLRETLDGVDVVRYRYAPERWQALAYGAGILQNLKRRPWTWLLLPGFVLSQSLALMSHRRLQPVAIHAHWIVPQGVLAAMTGALSRDCIPLVLTLHGSDVSRLPGRAMRLLRRFALRRSAAVTVVSEDMARQLRDESRGVSSPTVIPMGVDLSSLFTPGVATAAPGPAILFVGRLVEGKGLPVLLAAMSHLCARRPDAHLSIVGDGSLRAELEVDVATRGLGDRVQFLGARPQCDLPDLYRRSALMVAPYDRQEGLGLVVVEALGCGCPVITTKFTPLAEWVQGAGEVVAASDVLALADAIERVLSDGGRARAGAVAALPALKASFDWTAVASRFRDLLLASINAGARLT